MCSSGWIETVTTWLGSPSPSKIQVPSRRHSLQLKLAYSRHKDLNVKSNNDRSMDYTIPVGGPSGPPSHQGGAPPQQYNGGGMSQGAPIPASSYVGPGSELLVGGGGGPVGPQENPPSGQHHSPLPPHWCLVVGGWGRGFDGAEYFFLAVAHETPPPPPSGLRALSLLTIVLGGGGGRQV